MVCDIEIFSDGKWHAAATFNVDESNVDKGYSGAGTLAYDLQYAAENIDESGHKAVSMRHPVNFTFHNLETWPPFLLDLLPSGAGRRAILNVLQQPDRGPKSDWPLLLEGAGNPPGNLRIKQAATTVEQKIAHPGFQKKDIIEREELFIEYAHGHGAPVAGSSGIQGDAPKFLLTQDEQGNWHADGALHDSNAKRHWIVKFPRGPLSSDHKILRHEKIYTMLAQAMGLRVHAIPEHSENSLFIPRFDRAVSGDTVIRYGQESLTSLVGIADFGNAIEQMKIVGAILHYTTNPKEELLEYLYRDILNLALGNTDNHARNTAVRKFPNGIVELTPLFDFAPMFLDSQGISRVCRWGKHDQGTRTDWCGIVPDIAKTFTDSGIDENWLREALYTFGERLKQLPTLLAEYKTDNDLVNLLIPKIESVSASLNQLKNRSISIG